MYNKKAGGAPDDNKRAQVCAENEDESNAKEVVAILVVPTVGGMKDVGRGVTSLWRT